MKPLSFFTKLFFGNLLLVGVITLIVALGAFHYLNGKFQADSENDQDRIADVARYHFERTWPAPAQQIDEDCKRLFARMPLRLTVINKDGFVLGDSQADPARMENHNTPDRPEITVALQGKPGRNERTSETLNVVYRYFARPIEYEGEIVGVVRVAMPVRSIVADSEFIRDVLALTAFAAVIVAVILALILSWLWYSPLRQLTRAAGEIASGKLDSRVAIAGSAELARLSHALNEMRTNLAAQINQIASQRANLHTVVANLEDGVIAVDRSHTIILLNQAARKLLDVQESEPTGHSLQDIVRIPDAVDMIAAANQSRGPVHLEIEVETSAGSRTFILTAAGVPEPAAQDIHALLVVRDITEQARMAEVKSQFVANASHELRTPLATIRAAVDSLVAVGADDPDASSKFVAILDRHTRRLENMANDLLDLHMIESARGEPRKEGITLSVLIRSIQDQFGERAREKGIQLVAESPDPQFLFQSDKTLIQLILQNLIDNAIKFTPERGRVTCRIVPQSEQLLIDVSDTGCGINPEIQNRVFERFFQAEPSRARTGDPKSRGTGLGLAIVKHAAERLHGELRLQSTPGAGTTITLTLPLIPQD